MQKIKRLLKEILSKVKNSYPVVNIRPIGFLLIGPALFLFLFLNGTGEEGLLPYIVPLVFWAPQAAIVICDLVFWSATVKKPEKNVVFSTKTLTQTPGI